MPNDEQSYQAFKASLLAGFFAKRGIPFSADRENEAFSLLEIQEPEAFERAREKSVDSKMAPSEDARVSGEGDEASR